jgi:hypothetical protein
MVKYKRKGVIKINYDKNNDVWYSVYNNTNGLPDTRTNTILKIGKITFGLVHAMDYLFEKTTILNFLTKKTILQLMTFLVS